MLGFETNSNLKFEVRKSKLRLTTIISMVGLISIMMTAQGPHQCNTNDIWRVKVGSDGWQASANEVGFISFETMQLLPILLRVYRHSANPHLSARTEHTNGNLTCGIHNTIYSIQLLIFLDDYRYSSKKFIVTWQLKLKCPPQHF